MKRLHRRGFTLLEVLIAIALTLALAATMFAFLHDMLSTRSRTIERAAQQRAAATLIERLEADVATCLVGDARSGAGVQGDAAHLRLLTRGVMTQFAARGLEDPVALGDLQSVEYRFDASAQRLEARKGPVGETSDFATLGGAVAHVQFRYLDGRQWKASFDSRAVNHLPGAIEVSVWFNPWPGDQAAADDSSASSTGDRDAASAATRPGNFDDDAWAAASENETFRPPPPDRQRVIVIPDAATAAEDDKEAGSDE